MAVHTVIGVILVVWTTQAGWSAAQQQQPAALSTADEVYSYIARAVHQELQPIVSKLESQVVEKVVSRLGSQLESLDNRVALLDSGLSALTAHVLANKLGEQMDELSSQLTGITARLDSQQSQLNQLNNQLSEQKSQQEETAATVNNHTAQLDIIVTQQGDQLTQTSQLASRLDSQQSQLGDLNTQLNEQETTQREASVKMDNYISRLDNLISQIDIQGAKLSGAINNTSFQQETIDDLAAKITHHHPPRDCSDLPAGSPSGVNLLRPSGDSKQPPVQAYCDMNTAGGNWTVIQRRDNIQPRQDFYLGWTDYKEGFGNVIQEFWLGLEHLFQLTSSGRQYELRIDLETFDGKRTYAMYKGFRISSEVEGYTLSVSNYSGTAGDGLAYHSNRKFSTRDRDQDGDPDGHCAQYYQGAWWYDWCAASSLNGQYWDAGTEATTRIRGVMWMGEQSLKRTEMKIRPT